jgi:hypothetical protein
MWHVVSEHHDKTKQEDREEKVWTLSQDPNKTGWETDSGQDGYGLTYAQAKLFADSANHQTRLIEEAFEFTFAKTHEGFNGDYINNEDKASNRRKRLKMQCVVTVLAKVAGL